MSHNLRKLFQQMGQGNFGHRGRPGLVGGSAPDNIPDDKPQKAKIKKVTSSNGVPLTMTEDISYREKSLPLPNGKKAERYIVSDNSGKQIGRITETSSHKDLKKTASGVSLDRRSVTGYNAETFNEKYPVWERSMHTTNRSYAIDWLESRK